MTSVRPRLTPQMSLNASSIDLNRNRTIRTRRRAPTAPAVSERAPLMKPLIMSTSSGLTATAALPSRLSYWLSCGAMKLITRLSVSTARLGFRGPKRLEATSIAMAIRGPRPRRVLKLRSAARLAVLVSENVVAVVDTTLSRA